MLIVWLLPFQKCQHCIIQRTAVFNKRAEACHIALLICQRNCSSILPKHQGTCSQFTALSSCCTATRSYCHAGALRVCLTVIIPNTNVPITYLLAVIPQCSSAALLYYCHLLSYCHAASYLFLTYSCKFVRAISFSLIYCCSAPLPYCDTVIMPCWHVPIPL